MMMSVKSMLALAATGHAATIEAKYCDKILVIQAVDQCRLSNKLTTSMQSALAASTYENPDSSAAWTSCAVDAGVAAGESHEERTISGIATKEGAIKTTKASLADTKATIQALLSTIKAETIELAQQEIRQRQAIADYESTRDKKISEQEAWDRRLAEYNKHLEEMEAFLTEIEILLGPDSNPQSLSALFATSRTGGYNGGFEQRLRDQVEHMHQKMRQEYTHLSNEKARELSAFNTRKAALTTMICVAWDTIDNRDDKAENEVFCADAGTRGSGGTSNAAYMIQTTTDSIAADKVELQDNYKKENEFTEQLDREQADLDLFKKQSEESQKTQEQRIDAFAQGYSICMSVANAASFVQLESAKNVFVQTGSSVEAADPILRVENSLLATAEQTHNKGLAVFASSLAQVKTGGFEAEFAIAKIITMIKDHILALQKQIDLEEKGSWCENQQAQVASAVSNANSYVDSLQQQSDSYNNQINKLTQRQGTLNVGVYTQNTKINTQAAQDKATETIYEEEIRHLKEEIHGVSTLKNIFQDAPKSDPTVILVGMCQQWLNNLDREMQDKKATYKAYVQVSSDSMKAFKTVLARMTSELTFVQQEIERVTQALDETNAAMGEAKQSQKAAAEMQATFLENCETQDGAQIANGATALEKCAQTCQTISALEFASFELSRGSPTTTNSGFDAKVIMCDAIVGQFVYAEKKKTASGTEFSCVATTTALECTGAEQSEGDVCYIKSAAAGVAIFHSDVACSGKSTAVPGCDLIPISEGGTCDPSVGIQEGGRMLSSCRLGVPSLTDL